MRLYYPRTRPIITSKWASFETRIDPLSRAAAAIQRSFAGIGVPALRRAPETGAELGQSRSREQHLICVRNELGGRCITAHERGVCIGVEHDSHSRPPLITPKLAIDLGETPNRFVKLSRLRLSFLSSWLSLSSPLLIVNVAIVESPGHMLPQVDVIINTI